MDLMASEPSRKHLSTYNSYLALCILINGLLISQVCCVTPGPGSVRATNAPFYNVWTYPNPETYPEACRPDQPRPSHLCDPNRLISKEEADKIDYMLNKIPTNTKCLCDDKSKCKEGIVVTVALMPRIIKSARVSSDLPSQYRYFTNYLRTKSWNQSKCEEDALLVVSKDQKFAWLSRGVKVGKLINDEETTRIMDKARNLKNLVPVVQDIARLLGVNVSPGEHDNAVQKTGSGLSTWTIVGVIALVIGFIIVIALAAAGASYCGRKCNGDDTADGSERGDDYSGAAGSASGSTQRSSNILRSEKSGAEKSKESRKAWFGRVKRKDRRPSDKGSDNMYAEPDDEESDSYYNNSRSGRTPSHHKNAKRDSSDYDNKRRSGNYDNRHSGSYDDRQSDRNSGYDEHSSNLVF